MISGGGKQVFFLAINVRQFFFYYVSSKKFFVVCFPYYVRYHLVFFLVNIFFINFDNKLFFCPNFQQTFFSDFCGDKLFFQFYSRPSPPPTPRYQMVRPLLSFDITALVTISTLSSRSLSSQPSDVPPQNIPFTSCSLLVVFLAAM